MKKKLLILLPLFFFLFLGSSFYLHSLRVKEERLKKETLAWQALERGILRQVSSFQGEAGVVIVDFASGRVIRINPEKPFASASMVKVPIMAAYFEAEGKGALDSHKNFVLYNRLKTGGSGKLKQMPAGTQIRPGDLVELMISESDNTAANMLIEAFGFEYLNNAFKQFGLRNTTIVRKMMDFKDRKNGVENYTTASDMALLLKGMYFGRLVNVSVSRKCFEVLKKQKINDRIPALLPSGTVVAHKTGLEYGICHDAGIIFTDKGDFLVCVLLRHGHSTAKHSKRLIAQIAQDVYEYATQKQQGGPTARPFGFLWYNGNGKARTVPER